MPSTATITAFYSFTPNTKARATQVNANFDVFRGHLLPIDPNTATGSNNTYDLGSTEWNWRKGYIGELNLGATSTSWKLKDETTTGSGDLVFYKNNAEKFRIGTGQYTMGSGSGNFFATTVSVQVTNFSVGINGTGSPIEVGIVSDLTAGGSGFQLGTSSGNLAAQGLISLLRDGATIQSQFLQSQVATTTAAPTLQLPFGVVSFFDNSAPTGAITYSINIKVSASGTTFFVTYGKLLLKRF